MLRGLAEQVAALRMEKRMLGWDLDALEALAREEAAGTDGESGSDSDDEDEDEDEDEIERMLPAPL